MNSDQKMSPEEFISLEQSREEFEVLVYREHFGRTLFNAQSKFELTIRDRQYPLDYRAPEISAMWFGWKLAKGLSLSQLAP